MTSALHAAPTSRAHRRWSRRARVCWTLAAIAPASVLLPAGTAGATPVSADYALSFLAGTGTSGAPTDDSPATSSSLDYPYGVAADDHGNVYIADQLNNQIEKVSATGTLTVIAGNGGWGAATEGAATSSMLQSPRSVAVDGTGNVYIADPGNKRVEKVDTNGDLTFFAGTGTGGTPVAGAANLSPLQSPSGVAVDDDGNVYIADAGSRQVVKVDTGGDLTIIAGTGLSGTYVPGQATASPLGYPIGVAVDDDGNVYVADSGNNQIARIDGSTGLLSVVAGTGTNGPAVEGPATSSQLTYPTGVAADDDGNVYIADRSNFRVEKVDDHGNLTIIAGTGSTGASTEGPATASNLWYPSGVAVGANGNLYVAVNEDNRVVELAPTTSPAVTSPAPATATVGAPYNHTFTATGNPAATWSVTSGTLPTGLTLDPTTGVLSGTPTATGSTSFTVTATNTAGADAQVVSFRADASPTVTSARPAGATVRRPYSHTFTADGDPAATWSVTSGTLPTGLTLDPTTGVLSGTPTATGSTSFTVTATNTAGTGSQVVAFAVAATPVVAPVTPAPTPTPTATSPVEVPAAGVHRWGGEDRATTATAASRSLFPTDGSVPAVVVTTSTRYADAMAGARLASAATAPLLLTGGKDLDTAVATEIRRVLAADGTIYVLGGNDAVSPAVTAALQELSADYTVTRVAGADRYETATSVADHVAELADSTGEAPIYLATGLNHPDGLAVSALAARTGGVVLLTDGETLPEATRAYLAQHDPTGARTVPVGGTAAAAARTLNPGAADRASANAVVGRDRYDTARLLAERYAATDGPVTTVGLATGADWPDAMVGAAVIGQVGGPLLLTPPDALDTATTNALRSLATAHHLTTGLVFGGKNAVSSDTASQFGGFVDQD